MISTFEILLIAIVAGSVAKTLEDFRLPQIVIPKHYNLQILTDLQKDFYYKGEVSIELFVTCMTNEIVIHSKNLKIFENKTKLIEERNNVQSNVFSKIEMKSLKLDKIDSDEEEKVLDQNKFIEKENNKSKNVSQSLVNSSSNLSVENNAKQIHINFMSDSSIIFEPEYTQKNSFTSETQKKNFISTQKNHNVENQQSNFERSTFFPAISKTTSGYESNSTSVSSSVTSSVRFLFGTTNFPSPLHNIQPNTNKQSPSSFIRYSYSTTEFPESTKKPMSVFPTKLNYIVATKTTPATFTFTSLINSFSKSTNNIVKNTPSFPIKSSYTTKKTYKSTTTNFNKFQTENEKMSLESSDDFTEVSNYETIVSTELSTNYKTIVETTSYANHNETLNDLDTESFLCEKHDYKVQNDFLILRFNKFLIPGKKYKLFLNYEGILTDTLVGFHRVPYTEKGTQKSTWLASTVFEPNEARSAFPCFDEPSFKATFNVTLGHEKKYTALSNMPLETTATIKDKPEWMWSTFKTTPKMSTYLVAFFIGDFEYLSPQNQTKDALDVKYRFWARRNVLHKVRYAMRIAPRMKNFLENLLQVRDVLPKHDFIAIPSFASSALENWGLISFAEKNLLFTPGFSSIYSKFEITQVMGHEISHMWFGNMITPKWWDQIWLSEGFSNFFEILAVDHVQPQWDIKTVSAVFSYLKLFSLDAFESSHPLIPTFDDPSDLNDIFDSISYQKGFLLIRMLNYTLGQEAFLNGVRKYLKKNFLSNTDDNDLWEALSEYIKEEGSLPLGFDLKDVMHSWTRETGYPIVEIVRDYENNTASVTQQRFIRSKGDFEFRENSENLQLSNGTRWWIPITYTSGSELNFGNFKPRVWLNPSDDITIMTNMPSANDFILLNLEASGLYRVNYDERNWALLISHLLSENYSDISVINRVQILDNLLDLARAGKISYERALDATNYLSREKHFLPWKAALSNFDFISRMFRSTESNRILKKFLKKLITARFKELGFNSLKNESTSDVFNRKQIVKWACKINMAECTRKSVDVFKKWMEEKKPDENNPIPASLRSTVYCTAIENGRSKEWQFLWHRYLNPSLTDKTPFLYGLGCTKNTRTLKRYLDWSIKISSGVRKQDCPTIFKAVARNEAGFSVAKYFLKENLRNLRIHLGNNSILLPQILDTMASKMNKHSDLEMLEEIEKQNYSDYFSSPRSFRRAIERVKFNIDWVEKNYQTITNWLNKQDI